MQSIGVLGGTFDPVHCGHLRLALEMREKLFLSAVHLIPAAQPPHRTAPQADAGTRLRMLEAAVQDLPGVCVDARELQRTGPSYTVETLESLRNAYRDQPICLLLGMDAFCELHTWHRWQEIIGLAHIGVAHRPGVALITDGPLSDLLSSRLTDDPSKLRKESRGSIFVCEIPGLDISATQVRHRIAQRQCLRCLVPDRVIEIITQEHIYSDAE